MGTLDLKSSQFVHDASCMLPTLFVRPSVSSKMKWTETVLDCVTVQLWKSFTRPFSQFDISAKMLRLEKISGTLKNLMWASMECGRSTWTSCTHSHSFLPSLKNSLEVISSFQIGINITRKKIEMKAELVKSLYRTLRKSNRKEVLELESEIYFLN